MSKYAWVLVLSAAVPLFLSFYPKLKFYKHFSSLIYSIGLILLIFGAWDVFATQRGHWSFNSAKVWNIRIINLPLEEVLFL